MTDTKKLLEIRQAVEKMEGEVERAKGAMEHALQILKEQYNCSTIEEAQDLLKKMEKEEAEKKALFVRKYKAFLVKWGSKLGITHEL